MKITHIKVKKKMEKKLNKEWEKVTNSLTLSELKVYISQMYHIKYEGITIDTKSKEDEILIHYKNHTHHLSIITENQEKYYKITPYKDSHFSTPVTNKFDFSFDLVLFAIWELYNSSLQVK